MPLSRDEILAEMGITRWYLRQSPRNAAETAVVREKNDNLPPEITIPAAENNKPIQAETPEKAVITERHPAATAEKLLENVSNPLGMMPSAEKLDPTSPLSAATTVPISARSRKFEQSQNPDWETVIQEIHGCRACELCQHRQQAVPGVGDRNANWLFVGEGPGAEEDARGEPFVGQAGQLLDAMLAAIDLQRGQDVYIANAVKCRPPGNRTPSPHEMAACRPFLEQQITLVKPRLIVLLGKAAVHTVLGLDQSLASLRGRQHRYHDVPVIVTYHPAYLLRNLPDKLKAWEDLLFARRVMRDLSRNSSSS